MEYQVSANNLFKLFYRGRRASIWWKLGTSMPSRPDFGANNPALQAAAFADTQHYLPYPQFGSINQMSNTGHSTFHSGTVQYQKRY